MLSKMRNVKGFTLIELMVVVAIIGIILAIAIPYFISYKRGTCDKAANADAAKLSTSMERFGQELIDLNCQFEVATIGQTLDLNWVVGPFYGWSGTNVKCEVMVSKVNVGTDAADNASWEAWACAIKGSHPTSINTERYCYRYPLFGGKDRPSLWVSCEETVNPAIAAEDNSGVNPPLTASAWAKFGDNNCYTSSMVVIGNPCTVQQPQGVKLCADLVASD